MKVLVTGAKGFIGKNLIAELKNQKTYEIYELNRGTDIHLLDYYTKDCDFVFHLAGINRPKDEKKFMEGNYEFTAYILNKLKENENKSPILFPSSIQAQLDNLYGKSKKAAEDLLFSYGKENGVKVLVYRLPNVFGKWCKADYNSVVATFCNNVANNLEIRINDPTITMNLVYIDDVVKEFIKATEGNENKLGEYCSAPVSYFATLGRIAELILSFKETRANLNIPDMSDEFVKKLYSTYLSYLPKEQFSYPLKMNIDERGSFTEFIRTADRGQISINVSKPGITKGNHWHHTKNEKFLVVKGKGLIRFRKIDSDEIIDYHVSNERMEVVDIPAGYTHSLINEGDTDMVTVIWANEYFDADKPDTYIMEV